MQIAVNSILIYLLMMTIHQFTYHTHTHIHTHITFTRYNNTHIKFAGPNPRLIID
jgi:hypothetical protein